MAATIFSRTRLAVRSPVVAAGVRLALVALLACAAAPRQAIADRLTIASPVARSGAVTALYRLDRPARAAGTLRVIWTDGAGRLVLRRDLAVAAHTRRIAVTLDLRRAVVLANRLEARLTLAGGAAGAAAADFTAVPPAGWGAPVIVWQDQTPTRAAGLARLGVTAGRVFGVRGRLTEGEAARRVAPWLAAGLGCYVENIATDFYAAYHRYQPDHPVTWAFDQVRARHARDRADPAAFRRTPSLSDPRALAAIRARLAAHVRQFGPYRPLYYSLGDETGIADLAAAWDFDRAPVALAQFRRWLRAGYGTLARLNQQWGTRFAAWRQVMPQTTDQAIRGAGDNFSAWADFKAFMDAAFAGAVRAGTQAVHAADPSARAAIEGAQIPGWGGYDYARLAGAVDVMEIYDAGENAEIARALNPRLILLTTTAPAGPGPLDAVEQGRLWHALLLGSRGLIIWDAARALVDDDGRATALGTSYAALFAAFADGPGAQLAAATSPAGPVAMLYSPASFRIAWLLDRRADGQDWSRRDAETENGDSALRASMRRADGLLTHLGLPPRWISQAMLAGGVLRGGGIRVLLLPYAIALSPTEVAEIRRFAARGGVVLGDVPAGVFDAHGRRRAAPPLAGVQHLAPGWWGGGGAALAALAGWLRRAGAAPPFALSGADGAIATGIDARVLRDGAVTLIGLQRDPAAAPQAAPVVLTLARAAQVYDLRAHRDLGWTDRVTLAVGAGAPVLLALAPAPLPPLTLAGPRRVRAGAAVVLRIGLAAARPLAARVVHVETLDPAGQTVAAYGGNLVLRGGAQVWRVPLAAGDRPGVWTIRVADRLGGAVREWPVEVSAAGMSAPTAIACRGFGCRGGP